MTKIFSKNAVALNALKKMGEGAEIFEIDGKFHAMNAEEAAEYKVALEKAAAEMITPSEQEVVDTLQQQYDSEGTVTLVISYGVNPVGLDRSTTTVSKEHFNRTRYVIQQKQADASRKFLPAAGEELVAWKFHAAQFDTVEQAQAVIAGEPDLSVVPFRHAWLETFHKNEAPVSEQSEVQNEEGIAA